MRALVPGATSGDNGGQEPESADSFGAGHYGYDNTEVELGLNNSTSVSWFPFLDHPPKQRRIKAKGAEASSLSDNTRYILRHRLP